MAVSANVTRLMDNARIRLPGALDTALQQELFSVANDFLQGSNIWYEDITFAVTPTSDTYLQNPSAFTYTITPTLGSITRLVGLVDANGFPQKAYMPTLGQLILDRSPQTAQNYTCRVALTVTDPVTAEGYPDFPDWILNKYNTDFLNGLLGRMMTQTAKPYSNPQMGLAYMKSFNSAIAQAKVEAMRQNVYRGQNWKFPQQYATNRYSKF